MFLTHSSLTIFLETMKHHDFTGFPRRYSVFCWWFIFIRYNQHLICHLMNWNLPKKYFKLWVRNYSILWGKNHLHKKSLYKNSFSSQQLNNTNFNDLLLELISKTVNHFEESPVSILCSFHWTYFPCAAFSILINLSVNQEYILF